MFCACSFKDDTHSEFLCQSFNNYRYITVNWSNITVTTIVMVTPQDDKLLPMHSVHIVHPMRTKIQFPFVDAGVTHGVPLWPTWQNGLSSLSYKDTKDYDTFEGRDVTACTYTPEPISYAGQSSWMLASLLGPLSIPKRSPLGWDPNLMRSLHSWYRNRRTQMFLRRLWRAANLESPPSLQP